MNPKQPEPQSSYEAYHHDRRQIINRLSRASGHLQAVKTMLEDGRDCTEILVQLAAVRSALNRISEIILIDHVDHCLTEAVANNDPETLESMKQAVRLLLK